MFLILKFYWFLYVLDHLKIFNIFFGFIFYELIIIPRYLIPSCLCSAKWHELSGMILVVALCLNMENCVGSPLYSQKHPLYVPRLDGQHRSGPSTEPLHESELRYGRRSAGVEPHLQLVPR